MVTVALTRDHKPEVEQQEGAIRLQHEKLFCLDGTTYLHREGCLGQPLQMLPISRSLGHFDLTGEPFHVVLLFRVRL